MAEFCGAGVLVAQAGSVRDVAYAQAQAGLWNQATTLDNARQTRLAAAEVAWRAEQYTAQVTVTTALASTSTTPWAAFQRDLALAQQSWWTTTGASYTASVANANLAATAYQTLVSAACVVKAQLLATLDLNAAKAQAADALAQTTAIALAEKAHEDGLATARREYLVNMAHALVDQRNLLANAEYKRLAEVSFDYDGSVRLANDERQADEQSAKTAYSTSVAGVEGQYGVDSAQADLKYAQDSAGHTQTWTTGRAAAEKGCGVLEAAAYKTLSITTGALDTAYRRQAAQTQQAALASLAQNSATPWSALEAARAAAFADWTGTTTGAADIRRTTVANAQAALELRQAAADEVYSGASGSASNAQWISAARAALATAQAKAASLLVEANAGRYEVTLPRADALPAHDDIVDVLLPGAYTAPTAKFDATYEAFGLADAPSTMPGYYGYGWNGYGWNGWWGCYGWWYASWWNGGYWYGWYGWYGDGLTNDSARLESIEAEQARAPAEMSSIVPRISNSQTPTIVLLGGGLSPTSLFPDDSAAPHLYEVCFAAGTLVLMADGSRKPIEAVRVGEFVLAVSQHHPEGQSEANAVREVYHNPPQPLCEVRVGDSVIRTTANHPFYVRGRGFVAVAELQPGDSLRSAAGRWVEVAEVMRTDEVQPVFNLQIAHAHTYFVAAGEDDDAVLVHNESPAVGPVTQKDVDALVRSINAVYMSDRKIIGNLTRAKVNRELHEWTEGLDSEDWAQYAFHTLDEIEIQIHIETTPQEQEDLRVAKIQFDEAISGEGKPYRGQTRLNKIRETLILIRDHDLKLTPLLVERDEVKAFITKYHLNRPTGEFRPVTGLKRAVRVGRELLESCIPGIAEAMDAAVLGDPQASAMEKTLAAASLAANCFTGTLAPNYGQALRARRAATAATGIAADRILRAAGRSELARQLIVKAEMHSLDLGPEFLRAGRREGLTRTDSLVYIVRDKGTGDLLKVGQTSRWETRFGEYVRRAKAEGRTIDVTVFKVDAKTALDRVAVERQIRLNLRSDGHTLPWDNTIIGKQYLD